jgi:uncharacterized protein YndB with AHSA1/START domain
MAAYSFVTTWRFQAPLELVWQVLNEPARYPEWWPSIVSYRPLTPGLTGVGARGERAVRGRLPYTLRYTTTVTRHEPPRELAYDATGDLVGRGRFVLTGRGGGTEVVCYWDVETTGVVFNLLAPVLRWLFAWNHNQVMRIGERGLAQWLQRQRTAAAPTGSLGTS